MNANQAKVCNCCTLIEKPHIDVSPLESKLAPRAAKRRIDVRVSLDFRPESGVERFSIQTSMRESQKAGSMLKLYSWKQFYAVSSSVPWRRSARLPKPDRCPTQASIIVPASSPACALSAGMRAASNPTADRCSTNASAREPIPISLSTRGFRWSSAGALRQPRRTRALPVPSLSY
jgi:hypothetical protein